MIKEIYQTSDGKTFNTLREAEAHEARKLYTVTFAMSGDVCVQVYAKDKGEAERLAENEFYSDDINWEIIDVEIEEE